MRHEFSEGHMDIRLLITLKVEDSCLSSLTLYFVAMSLESDEWVRINAL